jgi:hypothetical protein
MVVRLTDGVTMTVLVPNADEEQRQRLPGAGARVRLSWATDHMHVVRESEVKSEPEGEPESDPTATGGSES